MTEDTHQGYTIGFVTTPADIADCLAVRRAVFVEEFGISESDELDGEEQECLHVLARARDGEAVGAARLRLVGDTAKVERVCVLAAERAAGIGRALLITMIAEARRLDGLRQVKLGSMVTAMPFYEGLGFHAVGAEYQDVGLPHRDMVLVL